MLKTLTIKRRKKFAGSAIKFFVVLNMKGSAFNEQVGMKEKFSLGSKSTFLTDSDQVFSVKNGEEITIDLTGDKNSFFIMAFTSMGRLFSHRVVIDDWKQQSTYTVEMKMGATKNQFIINEI